MNRVKRICNKRVEASPGSNVSFHQDLVLEVICRTGGNKKEINFILDTYREVILDRMLEGDKVEISKLGFIVPLERVGRYSPMLQRNIPRRFHPKFIFGETLRKRYKEQVTVLKLNLE